MVALRFDPPAPLVRERFHIRPQRADDNDSDNAAVTANRGWLRRWSGSAWPEDAFTLAENLEALRGHIDDHERREAYGFSITAPNDSTSETGARCCSRNAVDASRDESATAAGRGRVATAG
jgi:hypothetical protein